VSTRHYNDKMADKAVSAILRELANKVASMGHKPGSVQFDVELRQLRVNKCKEFQVVDSCEECRAFDSCELIKLHLRDLRYGVPVPVPPKDQDP